MEATIMGYKGTIGYILGLYRDNGKEYGNYYDIIGYISPEHATVAISRF